MLKMIAVLDGKVNGMNFEEFRHSGNGLTFGGFNFDVVINGEEHSVNFDWDSFVANIREDGTLLLKEGEPTLFGGDEALDDVYDEEYLEAGFTRADLTAKLLAETTQINEFVIDYDSFQEENNEDYLHILELKFVDENGEYPVSGEVLDRFNGMDFLEPIRAYGDLGAYDSFCGDYPDETDLAYAEENIHFDDTEELPF